MTEREAVEDAMAAAIEEAWYGEDGKPYALTYAQVALDAALAAGCLLPGIVERIKCPVAQCNQGHIVFQYPINADYSDIGSEDEGPCTVCRGSGHLFILRGTDDA